MDVEILFPQVGFVQGDTWNVIVSLASYPASQWCLTYVLKMVGANAISIVSTPASDGQSHSLSASTVMTAAYSPGLYQAIAYVTKLSDQERYTLGHTSIKIDADLTNTASAFDPRTPNQQILDQINLALKACLGDAIQEYTIGGTSVKKNKTELLKMKTYYEMLVRKEKGLRQGGFIRYGFAPSCGYIQ